MLRSFLMAAVLLLGFVTMASAQDGPPGAVYSSPPFNMNPKHFTMTTCRPKLDCNVSDSAALQVANECASSRFGFPADIMSSFVHQSGSYKSCAIPSTFAKTGPGLGAKAQWPICCLTPSGDGDNTCRMVCHFYLTNDYNG